MDRRTTIKVILATLVLAGIVAVLVAALIGGSSPYRDLVIVAGIDGLVVGSAGLLLLRILAPGQERPAVPANDAARRSLDHPAAISLRAALVQALSRADQVNISAPADDREAQGFARQIAIFLSGEGFQVADIRAEPPGTPLPPGVGVAENNHLFVGPSGRQSF